MQFLNAGLAVLHIATGAFFVDTGIRKNFMPAVRAKVEGMFDSHGVPKRAQYAVMAGELLGGLGLLTGTLTHVAALGLLVIMAGAYKLDTWPTVRAKQGTPYSVSQLFSNALCTPEAQLIIILAAIALMGAGSFSIDGLIW
jgi:uncharacterized membrane protein YphA (DoxX/SURF4 family)